MATMIPFASARRAVDNRFCPLPVPFLTKSMGDLAKVIGRGTKVGSGVLKPSRGWKIAAMPHGNHFVSET